MSYLIFTGYVVLYGVLIYILVRLNRFLKSLGVKSQAWHCIGAGFTLFFVSRCTVMAFLVYPQTRINRSNQFDLFDLLHIINHASSFAGLALFIAGFYMLYHNLTGFFKKKSE